MTRSERIARTHQISEKKKTELNSGHGFFVFKNRTTGDITLPKPSKDGRLIIAGGAEFVGDSYFMNLIGPPHRFLSLVKEVNEEGKDMENKLLVDQPNKVTSKGAVEHVASNKNIKLNDATTSNTQEISEVLLTEDPMDGVEIIME